MAEASVEESGGASEKDGEAYSGLFGAIPYAFGSSRSWLFKAYVVVGGLAALLVAILIALSLVTLVSRTASAGGGSLTLSRALADPTNSDPGKAVLPPARFHDPFCSGAGSGIDARRTRCRRDGVAMGSR